MKHSYKTQCKNKKSYPSHASAGSFLGFLRKRSEEAKNLEPYFCIWCETWHLGHKPDDPELLEQSRIERLEAIKREQNKD